MTTPDPGRVRRLDALSPVRLRARVKAAVRRAIDRAAWERCGRVEEAEAESLSTALGAWGTDTPGLATEYGVVP